MTPRRRGDAAANERRLNVDYERFVRSVACAHTRSRPFRGRRVQRCVARRRRPRPGIRRSARRSWDRSRIAPDGARVDVVATVLGDIATVTLQQRFRNCLDRPVRARFVFPLPDSAAVEGISSRVGARGANRERDLRARFSRRVPYVFTLSLGDIPPGSTTDVEVHYLQATLSADDSHRFVFPTMLGRSLPTSATRQGSCDNRQESSQSPSSSPASDGTARSVPPALSLQVHVDARSAIRSLEPGARGTSRLRGLGPSIANAVARVNALLARWRPSPYDGISNAMRPHDRPNNPRDCPVATKHYRDSETSQRQH